jgi:transglutaminase 1
LDEYVFSETGRLYLGTRHRPQGRPWVFGQLRDSVLPAVCHLLDLYGGEEEDDDDGARRADPVYVVRAVAGAVRDIII